MLFEIIPGAVRRNILTRQETDDRIENVIKDWLKHASDSGWWKKKEKKCGRQSTGAERSSSIKYLCELHLE
jgi:hypothetical protein